MTTELVAESLALVAFDVRRRQGGRVWVHALDLDGNRVGHLFDWAGGHTVLSDDSLALDSDEARIAFWRWHALATYGYLGVVPPVEHCVAAVAAFVDWARQNSSAASSGTGPFGCPASGRVVEVRTELLELPVRIRLPHDAEWLELWSWLSAAPDGNARAALLGDFGRRLTGDPDLSDVAADFILGRITKFEGLRVCRRTRTSSVSARVLGGDWRVSLRFAADPSEEIRRARRAGLLDVPKDHPDWLGAHLELYRRLARGVDGYEAEVAPAYHRAQAIEALVDWAGRFYAPPSYPQRTAPRAWGY